jgi:DNA-binding XRE family transcriptional regulator
MGTKIVARKKINNKAQNNKVHKTSSKLNNLTWHTTEEVFKKAAVKNDFKKAYAEETSRIEMALALKNARKEQKMTQAKLAKKAEMPQSAIARLESGNHGVSFETISKVAFALGKQIKIV